MSEAEKAAAAAAAEAAAKATAGAGDKGGEKAGEKKAEYKPPTQEEHEKLQKALAESNRENAERRTAAKKADDEKLAAERAKAEAEGNITKVRELDKKEIEDRDKKLAELSPKAARADKLEAIVKSEVDALEKQLGEQAAKSVAHLDPADRLPILKQYAALNTGRVGPKGPKGGAPPAFTTPAQLPTDPDELRQFYLDNPKAREEALRTQRPVRNPGGF
jgi:hypothetical protein